MITYRPGHFGYRFGSVRVFRVSGSSDRGQRIHLVLDLFSVRFGSDSFGFGSVRIVNVGTGKYPEKVRFSFGSGSGSDSSDSSDNLDKISVIQGKILNNQDDLHKIFGYFGLLWTFRIKLSGQFQILSGSLDTL